MNTDRAALAALYNATNGSSWQDDTNWLSNRPLGEWHGVSTDADGCVADLRLDGKQLSGSIPAELGNLDNLVLQRQFISQGDFRDQFGPETYCHERTALARSWPNTKDQTPYLAIRRCNTRDLARKPIGRVSYYVNQTHYSRIGRGGVYNKFHKPIITSIIDVKKITACGESGFPAGFLVLQRQFIWKGNFRE